MQIISTIPVFCSGSHSMRCVVASSSHVRAPKFAGDMGGRRERLSIAHIPELWFPESLFGGSINMLELRDTSSPRETA